MVWLSSWPMARRSWVWSARGRSSIASSSPRAAVASVVPVSPSPDFASSAFKSSSASISTSQHRRRNRSVSGLAEGVCRIGRRPSGMGTASPAPKAFSPGQAVWDAGRPRRSTTSSLAGRSEIDRPCMSSEVITEAGPTIDAIRSPMAERRSSSVTMAISNSLVPPRLFTSAT